MDKERMSKKKYELRDIFIAHDVQAFRLFLTSNKSFFPDLEKVLVFDDDELSEMMHTMKAGQLHFGVEWQKSRNHFRLKRLGQSVVDMPDRVSGALLDFELANDYWPLCLACKYFREPSPGETLACMHRGGSPEDVACIGWTPHDDNVL